jgi:hypothetical protein
MPKVHIRKKALTKGRHSLYLDFSPPLRNPKTGKPQRYEFLGLFTYDKPCNVWERNHNTDTRALAIRSSRIPAYGTRFAKTGTMEHHVWTTPGSDGTGQAVYR